MELQGAKAGVADVCRQARSSVPENGSFLSICFLLYRSLSYVGDQGRTLAPSICTGFYPRKKCAVQAGSNKTLDK